MKFAKNVALALFGLQVEMLGVAAVVTAHKVSIFATAEQILTRATESPKVTLVDQLIQYSFGMGAVIVGALFLFDQAVWLATNVRLHFKDGNSPAVDFLLTPVPRSANGSNEKNF